MNLPRLRELHAAWRDGSIRAAELTELRDMLPDVMLALDLVVDPCPECDGGGEYETDFCPVCEAPKYTFCDACAGTGRKLST